MCVCAHENSVSRAQKAFDLMELQLQTTEEYLTCVHLQN